MGQLFARLEAKENDAKQKIEQYDEKANIKAFLADHKKLSEKFAFVNKQFKVDIHELIVKNFSVAKDDQT